MRSHLAAGLLAVLLLFAGLSPAARADGPPLLPGAAPVTVATFDTGTNPFHPCFRRDQATPADALPLYPKTARPLNLTFLGSYPESLAASQVALEAIEEDQLYYVPGTNLSFYDPDKGANRRFVDDYPHGTQASSQIACDPYGMGANAQLVILNYFDDSSVDRFQRSMSWVVSQSWIDVIHLNIQDIPYPLGYQKPVRDAIASGKLVVVAAGNGVLGQGASYPTELSRYSGPPGSLIAGANDNEGWTIYSNLNPHVVMDGGGTVAAAPDSFEDVSFSGTSSSSPRITGYVARLLGILRLEFDHNGRGLLTIRKKSPRPSTGPLADRVLSAAELHEVVRKTANPNPHESFYDGIRSGWWMPQPLDLPFSYYAKMGYGEISEHTLMAAVEVAAGRAPLPDRPFEDQQFEQSEDIRDRLWK